MKRAPQIIPLKTPEALVVGAIALQVLISLALIIYFFAITRRCGAANCTPDRLVDIPYINETLFVSRMSSPRAVFYFYNVFVLSGSMYLATTALMLMLLLLRFGSFLRFKKKLLFVGVLAVYIAFLMSMLLFPQSYGTSTLVERQIIAGEVGGYLSLFCVMPVGSLLFATAFAWQRSDRE